MTVLIPITSNQLSRIVSFYGPDQWRRPPCAFGLRWSGPLDQRLIQASLSLLPWRHTALRTYFPPGAVDGHACLTREPADDFPITTVDLTTQGAAGARQRERAGMSYLCAPFDMGQPPLYRAVSFQYTGHVMLGIAVDHAVFDGVSARVLADDLTFLYEALAAGADPAELAVQASDFAEFAAAERSWPQSPEGSEAIKYWLDKWNGLGPFPDPGLPNTIATSASPGASSTWQRGLSARQFQTVVGRARSLRVTPFIVAATAMFAALHERSGWRRHGLITPYARRSGKPGEGLGNYSNGLLLAVDGLDSADGERLTSHVADTVWDALQHGMMPFEDLMRLTGDGPFARPVRPYLHFNFVTRPGPFSIDGTRLDFTWLADDATYSRMSSGMFVTLEVTPSGGADLECGYGAAYYACDVIDEFMSAVERHLLCQ